MDGGHGVIAFDDFKDEVLRGAEPSLLGDREIEEGREDSLVWGDPGRLLVSCFYFF